LKAAKVRLNEIKQHVERKFADEQSFILQRELKELNKQQLLRFHNLETQLTNNVCFLFVLTRVAMNGPSRTERSSWYRIFGSKVTRTARFVKNIPKNAITSACLDNGKPNFNTFSFFNFLGIKHSCTSIRHFACSFK